MNMNFFCVQCLGFLFQTLPFTVLLVSPISSSSYKYPLPLFMTLVTTILIIASLGFAFMSKEIIQYVTTVEALRVYANSYFSIIVLGISLMYFRYVKVQFMKKVMMLVIVFHYGAFVFMLTAAASNLCSFVPDYKTILIYNPGNTAVMIGCICITFPFLFLFMRKIVRQALPSMGQKAMKRGNLYMISALLLYCVAVYTVTAETQGAIYSIYQGLSVLMIVCTDMIVYYMFFIEANMTLENAHLQQQVLMIKQQYHKITSDIEEAKQIRHDMYQHLNVIAALQSQQKQEELISYVTQYAQLLHKSDAMIITGHPFIDSIFRYYKTKADHANLEVHFHVDNFTSIQNVESAELTVLLSHALDYAVDKCKQLSISSLEICLYLHHCTMLFSTSYASNSKSDGALPVELEELRELCERKGGSLSLYHQSRKQVIRYVWNMDDNIGSM